MSKTSKWFVVATEGATTDGRTINRSWIEQMAEQYDPKNTYAARINLDHIKTWLYRENEPHAQAYGDVLAVKAQEREDGKLQLLAQISPTDDLIALNKKRQKIYTSIEVDPNFADSGKAYLVGLAVTDDPASLGTEMLQFAANAKANPFTKRKQKAENVFTEAVEADLEFEEQEEPKLSIFARISAMFAKKERSDDERFMDQENAIELLSEHVKNLDEKLTALSGENDKLKADFAKVQDKAEEINGKFAKAETTPASDYSERPKATGETQSNGYIF